MPTIRLADPHPARICSLVFVRFVIRHLNCDRRLRLACNKLSICSAES